MNASVQLPSDDDQSSRDLSVKELDLVHKILKTGRPKTEPVEAQRTSEPQFGTHHSFDSSDMKP